MASVRKPTSTFRDMKPEPDDDNSPGLPGFRSWRGVYWFVFGCFVLVTLYASLVLWALRVASTAKDRFGAVLAVGVGALVFWHAFFNLGMVTGLLPVVGVTLPLFSYGGSSVLTILMGLGLLMNVSTRRF